MTPSKNGRNKVRIKAQFGKFKDSDVELLKSYMGMLSSKDPKSDEYARGNTKS